MYLVGESSNYLEAASFFSHGWWFGEGVGKYEWVLVPVVHSRTPGAPSSDDGLDPRERLFPLPLLLMTPLSFNGPQPH